MKSLATASKAIASAMKKKAKPSRRRSEEHTSELQSRLHLVCRLLLEKKKAVTLDRAQLRSARRSACAPRTAEQCMRRPLVAASRAYTRSVTITSHAPLPNLH